MAYLLLETDQKTILPWTEEEKAAKLQQLFKKQELLLPEDFYTPALSAEDLEQMLDMLIKHLGIRKTRLAAIFSDQIKEAGRCEIDTNGSRLVVHSRFAGDPFICAAVLAHTLCHYILIAKHKIYFNDRSENEKVADLATIHSGLGIIVLNGLKRAGWRSVFKRRISKKKLGTGYLHSASYGQLFRSYVNDRQIPIEKIIPFTVPWTKSLLGKFTNTSDRSLPIFMQQAEFLHRRSLRYFWLSTFIIILFIGSVAYVLLRRPPFLSDELRVQKQTIDSLAHSYQGCTERVARIKQDYDESEASIKRYIDNELVKCRSLQNRYNYEIEVYDAMTQNYDK